MSNNEIRRPSRAGKPLRHYPALDLSRMRFVTDATRASTAYATNASVVRTLIIAPIAWAWLLRFIRATTLRHCKALDPCQERNLFNMSNLRATNEWIQRLFGYLVRIHACLRHAVCRVSQ